MKRVCLCAILCLAMALPCVSHAGAVKNPDSVFGVVCPWGGINEAGIKWVRCGAGCTALDWGAIEKERGVFDWSNADKEVRETIKNEGVDLLPILGYTPKWASSGPNGENSFPPKDLRDWSDFVYKIVSRYKDKIGYWEVWNEPDIGFWRGSIEDYAALLKSAYVAAKKADPSCKIVFGGTAGVNLQFIERVYENGGGRYFDVMAVHPYQWGDTFDDEAFTVQLMDLHNLMKKHGDAGKEIWLTEFGWSTGDKGITEEIQARLLAQAYIASFTLRESRVTKAFWFSVKDWGGPGYGLFAADGSRKRAFEAYRWVSKALDGMQFLHPADYVGLRLHLFRKDGKMVFAAWSPNKEVSMLQLPSDVHWTLIRRFLKDPEPLTESKVMVGPEPVFIYSSTPIKAPAKSVGKVSENPFKLDVWCSVPSPVGTTRPYVLRGRQNVVPVLVRNDSAKAVSVGLLGRIGGFTARADSAEIASGGSRWVSLVLTVPAGYKSGLDTLMVTGRTGDENLVPISIPVRVADGPSVEFPANSQVESAYMVEDNGSGGAPSVRFNGTWTYKFDLSNAKGAALDMCVGAHEANEWRVLLSSDRKSWDTALSGKSNRSWHSVDVTPYAGGPLYVKFEGNDQQLSELVLSRRAQ